MHFASVKAGGDVELTRHSLSLGIANVRIPPVQQNSCLSSKLNLISEFPFCEVLVVFGGSLDEASNIVEALPGYI